MEAISTNSSARENLRLALSIFPSSCVQTATTLVQPFQQINKSYKKSTATECIFIAKLIILSFMFEINHFVLTSIVSTLSNPCDLPTNAKLSVKSLVFFSFLHL